MQKSYNNTLYIDDFIDERPMRSTQYITVLLCGFLMFIDGLDVQTIAYIAPLIGSEWNIEKSELGILFSAGLAGMMFGYIAIAPLSSKFGHKYLVFFSIMSTGILILMSSLVDEMWQLLLLRSLTGIGLGALVPSCVTISSEYSPKRNRATSVMLIYVGSSSGFIFAGIAAAWILPDFGWRMLFIIIGILTLLFLPFVYFFMPESLSSLVKNKNNHNTIKRILSKVDKNYKFETVSEFSFRYISKANIDKNKAPYKELFSGLLIGTIILWIAFSLNMAEMYALQNWLPTILEKQGFGLTMMATGTSVAIAGGIFAAFVVGPAMDRFNSYRVLSGLYILGAIFLVVLGLLFKTNVVFAVVVTFIVGLSVMGGQKAIIALAAIFYPPNARGIGVAWALGVGRTGAILGPLAFGFFIDPSWAPLKIFSIFAVPMALLGVLIFVLGEVYGGETTIRAGRESRGRAGLRENRTN